MQGPHLKKEGAMPDDGSSTDDNPVSTDGTTTEGNPASAAELNDGGKKALEAERDARKQADKAVKDLQKKLQEYENRDKSEDQKRQEAFDAAIADAATAQQVAVDAAGELARYKYAATEHIPPEYLPLLTGTTEDQLTAQGAAIKELMSRAQPTGLPGLVIHQEGRTPPDSKDPETFARQVLLG